MDKHGTTLVHITYPPLEDPDSIAAEVEESGDYRQDIHEILIRIENLFTSKVEMHATSKIPEVGLPSK